MPARGGRLRRTTEFAELVEQLEVALGTLESRGASPSTIAKLRGGLEKAAERQPELQATGEISDRGFKAWRDWMRDIVVWVSKLDSDLERILSLDQVDVPKGFDVHSCFCGCGTEVGAELYAANRAGAEVLKELRLWQETNMAIHGRTVNISPWPVKDREGRYVGPTPPGYGFDEGYADWTEEGPVEPVGPIPHLRDALSELAWCVHDRRVLIYDYPFGFGVDPDTWLKHGRRLRRKYGWPESLSG